MFYVRVILSAPEGAQAVRVGKTFSKFKFVSQAIVNISFSSCHAKKVVPFAK